MLRTYRLLALLPTQERLPLTLRLDGFSTRTYQGVAHPECGNTVKIIARLLYRLKRSGIPFRLAAWHCGTAENFNPLDGAVTLTADAPQEQVNALLEAEFAVLDKEIADARYAGQMHIETGVRAQKALSAEDSAALSARLGAAPVFERYRIAIRRFQDWLQAWFGPAVSIQSFERCVAIAFVFPVALFLLASLLYGYKNGEVGTGELLLFLVAAAALSVLVRWVFQVVYASALRAWRSIGGDPELAELIARILLGAFAVVFAFAIAFAVASSVAGAFSDFGTVAFAILGGFAFAFAFAVAFAVAGGWAFAIALVLVTLIALTMAKQFAFFLLLFFVILPLLNAMMDWGSWTVTRYLLEPVERAPDDALGIALVIVLIIADIAAALFFVVALAAIIPIGLELVDVLLSVFGRETFDWRALAARTVRAPWDEGLFVTGMLLTPLAPTIASMTLGLAALLVPLTPGAMQAAGEIIDSGDLVPDEAETRNIAKTVHLSRLWYIPALLVVLGLFMALSATLYATATPVATFLHDLALCATAWGYGACPWVQG